MAVATSIIRCSMRSFFQSYHSFTSIAALLVFPVSASVLLSQALTPSSSVLHTISSSLGLLFRAANFPASDFFSLVNVKLSETIFTSICTLPFTLTFLLLAKASIIHIFRECRHSRVAPPRLSEFLPLYRPLLLTHLFNNFLILSTNAVIFSLLFLAFNAVDTLHLSSSNSLAAVCTVGALFYCVVIADTMVVCNMAVVVSAMEDCSGYRAVLKASVLMKGQFATALALALPTNLGMAAVEALFRFRVTNPYRLSGKIDPSAIWEVFSIVYIYSLFIVLEVIVSCIFYKACQAQCYSILDVGPDNQRELEPEEKVALQA
ncbi:uncharacterized protein [Typha angustifolia]|uniref:uncharacterized protein n=1 Tax=Typha angustifolia TaxID=59011 RepID=UPI003C2DA34E